MIDPTPEPQSSDPTSAPDREPNCPPIASQSMAVASASDLEIDDQQWAEIVLSGLSTRSSAAREALLKALLDDEPARSIGSSTSFDEGSSIGERKASGYAGGHDDAQASPVETSDRNHGNHSGDRNGNTETSAPTVPPIPSLRSNDRGKASTEDGLNGERDVRNGGVPLLGLELTTTEKAGLNPIPSEDSNQSTPLAPLLGTIASQSTENSGKSSERRSPERGCYGELLRFDHPSSPRKSRKTVSYGPRGCSTHSKPTH